MELNDLLVSYNQVVPDKIVNTQPEVTPTSDRYSRMTDYIQRKEQQKSELSTNNNSGWQGWTSSKMNQPTTYNSSEYNSSENTFKSRNAPAEFKKVMSDYMTKNPQYKDLEDSLTKIAQVESGFKTDIPNIGGYSTSIGLFQFVDGTRKKYSPNLTKEQFAKDPYAQIDAACRMARDIQKQTKGKNTKGLTPTQILYGMWWRPESMLNYLNGVDDNYTSKDGMKLVNILNRIK